MKRLQLILVLLMFFVMNVFSQCPEHLYLQTQEEIDNFIIEYPDCQEISGSVSISGENITNLLGLSNLLSIGGHLVVSNTLNLTSLNGLHNLQSVGDYIYIGLNNSLTSLQSLENLAFVGGWQFGIVNNDALLALTNFDNLEQIEGSLIIEGNDLLMDLDGFNALHHVGGSVNIINNLALTSFYGFENIVTINGSLKLSKNYFVQDVSAFENLNTIGTDLLINKCNELVDLSGFHNLSSIGGTLEITENNLLESLFGLNNIEPESISNLVIKFNPFLSFCDVQSVCGYLADPNGDIAIYCNAEGCNNCLEIEEACAVSVDEHVKNTDIEVFPNPASLVVFVNVASNVDILEIKLINLLNQTKVMKEVRKNEIDLSDITPGIYIIEVVAKELSFRQKIIIQ